MKSLHPIEPTSSQTTRGRSDRRPRRAARRVSPAVFLLLVIASVASPVVVRNVAAHVHQSGPLLVDEDPWPRDLDTLTVADLDQLRLPAITWSRLLDDLGADSVADLRADAADEADSSAEGGRGAGAAGESSTVERLRRFAAEDRLATGMANLEMPARHLGSRLAALPAGTESPTPDPGADLPAGPSVGSAVPGGDAAALVRLWAAAATPAGPGWLNEGVEVAAVRRDVAAGGAVRVRLCVEYTVPEDQVPSMVRADPRVARPGPHGALLYDSADGSTLLESFAAAATLCDLDD